MNKPKIVLIIKNSISLVNQFDVNVSLEKQCQKSGLLESLKITQKQFDIYPTLNKKAIGIRNIFQNPNLRLTLYYLEKGNTMKLHDHNEMQVVSAVLCGKLQARLYRILNKKQSLYQKNVNICQQNSVIFIQGNKSYNLHELKALESTFFLDIIFPDYSHNNECNFYREKEIRSQNKVVLQRIDHDDIIFEDI